MYSVALIKSMQCTILQSEWPCYLSVQSKALATPVNMLPQSKGSGKMGVTSENKPNPLHSFGEDKKSGVG